MPQQQRRWRLLLFDGGGGGDGGDKKSAAALLRLSYAVARPRRRRFLRVDAQDERILSVGRTFNRRHLSRFKRLRARAHPAESVFASHFCWRDFGASLFRSSRLIVACDHIIQSKTSDSRLVHL